MDLACARDYVQLLPVRFSVGQSFALHLAHDHLESCSPSVPLRSLERNAFSSRTRRQMERLNTHVHAVNRSLEELRNSRCHLCVMRHQRRPSAWSMT